jgi:hypothetical protein
MRALAVAALIAGALIRIAILPLSVPAVDNPWRAWSFHAATRGPWNLYGPKGHTVRFGDLDEPVVYPPLALDELAIVGRAHLAMHGGRFENDVALTRTIKGAIVLLDAVLSMMLFLTVRRVAGAARAWWAAMAYWLNPAVLMITTLGFFDVFVAIPAVAAVIAGSYGRPLLTGALFAAAVLTKPQGLFVAPVAALALWNSGAAGSGARRLREAITATAVAGAILVAPVVAAGGAYDMLRSVAVLAGHDALSALAFNAWWIVSYLVAAADAGTSGVRVALQARPQIVTHAEAIARGFPHPRLIAIVVLAWPVLWTLTKAWRARDLGLQAALAGFMVVTYFTLSVQVHENHFLLAIPLLAVAAALRPAFAPVFTALSLSFALNLYLVYGVRGDGPAEWITTIAGIDATVLLAVAACALFGWFAATLAAASSSTSRVMTPSGTMARMPGQP